MKINKYRLGTPLQYTPWTFEQLGFAPAYMTAKHEAAQKGLFDTESGLDFEYLEKDESYVTPKVQALKDKINQISSQLAKAGVNRGLEDQLINLKREYLRETSPHGTLGMASKAYADAMNQWSEWKKANPKASSAYQQKAKQRFFGEYKGMKDPITGKNVGFVPGAITGERDITADFLTYAKETGHSGDLAKILNGQARITPVTANGETFLKIEESTPGVVLSNKNQLQSLANQFLKEYSDKNYDRGLYANIQGLSKQDIANTLANMSGAMYDERYAVEPRTNVDLTHVPNKVANTKAAAAALGLPYQTNITVDPTLQKEIDEDTVNMEGAFGGDNKFNSSGAKGTNAGFRQEIVDPLARLLNTITYDPKNPTKELISTGGGNASEKASKTWDKYKTEFRSTYDDYERAKKAGKPLVINGKKIENDKDWFYNVAVPMKQSKAALMGSDVALSNYDAYEDIYNKGINPVLVKQDDPDEKISFNEGLQILKKSEAKTGFGAKNRYSGIDADGNLIITLPTGKGESPNEKYIVKNVSLDATLPAKNVLNAIKAQIEDYTLNPEEIRKINNGEFRISGDSRVRLQIDPNNTTNRKLYYETVQMVPTQDGTIIPQWVSQGETTLSQIRAGIAGQVNELLNTKAKE